MISRSGLIAAILPFFLASGVRAEGPLINPGESQGDTCPLSGQLPTNNATPQSMGASCRPWIFNRNLSVTFGAGAPRDYAGIGDQRAGTAGGSFDSALNATTGTGSGTSTAGSYGTGSGTFGAGIGSFGTNAGEAMAGTNVNGASQH